MLGRLAGIPKPQWERRITPVAANPHCDAKERGKEQMVVDKGSDGTHASDCGQAD